MVEEGETAVIHYTARIAEGEREGEVFDTTLPEVAMEEGVYYPERDYMPMEIDVGSAEVIEGLDKTLRDMEEGEERTVVFEPDEAYGEWSEERVVKQDIEDIEGEVEEDTVVGSETGESGWVTDVDEEKGTVTIDFNHELAGKKVEFEIELLQVE